MTDERKTITTIQAVIGALVSVLSLAGTLLGISPDYTAPYMAGLVTSVASGLVSLFYAVRRIRAGLPADPNA